MLRPNGILIVFVPAYKFLWSVHDISNYHFRRYSKWELYNKLLRANYSIVRCSYWNFILFTPIGMLILMSKLIARKSVHSNKIFSIPVLLNNLLIKVMRFENKLVVINNIPFGISIFFVARKNVMA
jgi:membrane protein required for beta-lactamase induction